MIADENQQLVAYNGELIAYADAKVHVQTPLVRYGVGVFEGVCGYWSPTAAELRLFRVEEHLRRLDQSARILRIDSPSPSDIRDGLMRLLLAQRWREDIHIRILIWVDGEGDMAASGPTAWSIVATPRPPRRSAALTAQVSAWRRIDDQSMPPRVKCVANYVNGRLALSQARLDGYDTALLLDRDGRLAEAPAACLFLVRDGVVVTPTVTDSILESVTRATALRLLREAGVPVEERGVDRTELYVAQEAFLCGSAQEIVGLATVDGHRFVGAPGPVTRRLQEAYLAAVRGELPEHAAWCTPVSAGAPVA